MSEITQGELSVASYGLNMSTKVVELPCAGEQIELDNCTGEVTVCSRSDASPYEWSTRTAIWWKCCSVSHQRLAAALTRKELLLGVLTYLFYRITLDT
ncbi:hypothetical protein TSMEX_002512 [Taenia solium]|eukprot:TsM_001154400 transcript=TsM_001154400 gene=TsM_001154400